MKKKMWIINAFIIIAFIISLSINVQSLHKKNLSRAWLIGNIYSELKACIDFLDLSIESVGNLDFESSIQYFNNARVNLERLDLIMFQFTNTCDRSLYYPGALSFGYISQTLAYENTILTPNRAILYSVNHSGLLTNNEQEYIALLRNDLNQIVENMTDTNDTNNVNSKLTISKVNSIFAVFYEKWSQNLDDFNPLLLLLA